jgi:hypothetical protein
MDSILVESFLDISETSAEGGLSIEFRRIEEVFAFQR